MVLVVLVGHLGNLYHGCIVCHVFILRYIGILEFDICKVEAMEEMYSLGVCY